MKKFNVAFMPPSDYSWIGGCNYFLGLLKAVKNTKKNFNLIVILPENSNSELITEYSKLADTIIIEKKLNKNSFFNFLNRVEQLLFGSGYLIGLLLRSHNVQVLSHTQICSASGVLLTGWIPDFQHLFLPENFSYFTRLKRTITYRRMYKKNSIVFISSQSAYDNSKPISGKNTNKNFILRFPAREENCRHSRNKFNNTNQKKFFLCSNQFWKHKNHILLLDAFEKFSANHQRIKLVLTGKLEDHRVNGYAKSIVERLNFMQYRENIDLKGVVSERELIDLQNGAIAIINPSLFEGWNTSVEEAKQLGVPLILSDIDIHREQAPEAFFFNPSSSDDLAYVMSVLTNLNSKDHLNIVNYAVIDHAEFGKKYVEAIERSYGV